MSTPASLINAVRPWSKRSHAHREAIGGLMRLHKGRTVAVFGSVARGDNSEPSDVDFLVELDDPPPKPELDSSRPASPVQGL